MRKIVFYFFIFIIFLAPISAALSSEVDEINQQIIQKQEVMKKLEAQIEIYKQNIQQKQGESITLSNQLAILNSQMEKITLDIQVTEIQISQLNLEVESLGILIKEKEDKINKERQLLAHLIGSIHLSDQSNYLSVFLSYKSFSVYFDQIKNLESISEELGQALKQIKTDRAELQGKRDIALKKKETVEKLQATLTDRQAHLEDQKEAKDYLFVQTKSSENKFKLLLAQLRQEYSQFDQELANLQKQAEKKLAENDKMESGPTSLSWPIDPVKGISVYFNDPTYPFRYLFEHTGVDIRVSQGTQVGAAASGYVAWVRTSRLYGNNIMIIHSNGIATLYAHLSSFNVKEDSFVKRGDIIGNSGGMPGTQGAGLSTGPHLHFEVRDNGIPVDPMNYLTR
ncbi:MAG: peptidoglycan DD-metalloendopeptidase family protein [Candidatus Magasanikbacteria bacterium]|nr:peptidoglycan DD-metalloendopeptidase family protein [Candidatus Magasanikbacteria bacterium]